MSLLPRTIDQKRHYASLDGLRGFAAISVLVFHLGQWLNSPSLAANSGLAVDLFFCLSGYVLPLAYRRQVDSLSTLRFLRTRLVRLMPLIALAIAIGAPYVVFRDKLSAAGVPYAAVATAVLLGLCNLPYFGAPRAIGGPELFPLNGPQYTLFLELIVNIVWWQTRRINQLRFALVLAILCFLLLPLVGLGGDRPDNFWGGFPRVGASFFGGVAMFHLEGRLAHWRGWTPIFWGLVGAMAVIFYIPLTVPFAIQLIWIAILSPLLVLTGPRARLSARMSRMCVLGGALSYPIYCLHYPLFTWINGLYRDCFGSQNIAVEGPLVVVAVFAVSFTTLRLYDEPIRRILTARLQHLGSAWVIGLRHARYERWVR
jgi:peptidoglycan/LPS O-acetylase OafA/YrhL